MPGELRTLTVGSDASVLDIFLSSGGTAVSGTFVGFEFFDAAGVSAASGVATTATLGTYKAAGTIPGGFQLGTWRVEWDIITVANDVQFAAEKFCVQAVDVKIGFVPATDKTATIYDAVRLDIGDPEGQVFDDSYMARILTKAVRRLNHRLGLSVVSRPAGIPGGFGGPRIKVSPIVADLDAGTITPCNDELVDLTIMMMEFIILTSELSALKRLSATGTSGPHTSTIVSATQDGISVTNADNVMISISPSRLIVRADLHKFDVKTKKEELEAAIKAFLGRMTGNFGKLIF